jgi:outer membrane protein assembly factor BamE (lipoprotein component of BamABCDE complex)
MRVSLFKLGGRESKSSQAYTSQNPNRERFPAPAKSKRPFHSNKIQGVNRGYFTRGSSKDEVLAVQGTPSKISDYSDHEWWYYGYSTVSISKTDGRVLRWSNTGDLKVELLPEGHVSNRGYFTRGSSKDEVLTVQGTPSKISDYSDHEWWYYGYSTVSISKTDGRVLRWNNTGNLKVKF